MRWLAVLIIIGVVAWLLMMRQEPKTVASQSVAPPPVTAPAPVPAAPALPRAVAPVATPAIDRLAMLRRAAQTSGVELRGFKPVGDGGVISLAWSSSNMAQGGDFLEQAVRQGAIRTFDVEGHSGASIENGRQVWLAEYTVHF